MSFESLKKQSKLGSLTEKLVKEVEKMNDGGGGADSRLWKMSLGKGDVGSAIIRFLPAPEGEEMPFVKVFNHAFKGPTGQWLIDQCPTTVGSKCPICVKNSEYWNSGIEDDKAIARDRKRKLSYYSNIYIINDPANPENNGQVKIFKYGKKIFDKILGAMQPEFEDETPIDPFDFWTGANFRLKIRKVEGYWNYDKSEFDSPGPLLDDDDALEAIWKKQYSLAAFISPDQFKSYEDLERRMNTVLGKDRAAANVAAAEEQYDSYVAPARQNTEESVMNELEESYRRSKVAAPPVPDDLKAELNSLASSDEDDDETLSYFQKLAS
jgi:hypothetical protein